MGEGGLRQRHCRVNNELSGEASNFNKSQRLKRVGWMVEVGKICDWLSVANIMSVMNEESESQF